MESKESQRIFCSVSGPSLYKRGINDVMVWCNQVLFEAIVMERKLGDAVVVCGVVLLLKFMSEGNTSVYFYLN